ncbi:MAG: hypothetical protein KAS48_07220, partial [Gammaproteobacteria bacterium]|nr:hypothetical protein [Gammaproteobacteria bacterium]
TFMCGVFYGHDCMDAGGRATQEQLPRMPGRFLLLQKRHSHHPWCSYPAGAWMRRSRVYKRLQGAAHT